MANYSVATNFDPHLLLAIAELNKQYPDKIIEVYGSLPSGVVGSGRPTVELPKITYGDLLQHIKSAHEFDLRFSYLINANSGIRLTDRDYARSVQAEIESLLRTGVDSLTIADNSLVEFVKAKFPEVKVNLSVVRGVDTVREVKSFLEKGVNSITLNQHTINRDFRKIEEIVKYVRGAELRLYANVSCLQDCPKRTEHYKYLSSQSQLGNAPFNNRADKYILNCALTYLRNPVELLKSPFIRPEDISVYEDLGIKTFKLSDRREPTTALINLLKSYLSGEFHGNLFDLLFREGRKWINPFTVVGTSLAAQPDIYIDNDVLTELDFISIVMKLKNEELNSFYRQVTSLAVRNVDSERTRRFLGKLESDYLLFKEGVPSPNSIN